MPVVFAILALVLIVALALVLSGRLPAVPQPTRDRYVTRLPEQPSAADVDQLRLPVAFRGYRMDEVDSAMATLRDRIAGLEAGLVSGAPAVGQASPEGSAPAAPAPVPNPIPGGDQGAAFAPPPDSRGDDA